METKPQTPSPTHTSTNQQIHNLLSQMHTLPNLITTTRILLTPYLSYLILTHQYTPAAVGCFLCALSDGLDGYIAKSYKSQSTVLGSYLDPLADKWFVTILSVTLGYSGALPVSLVGLWVTKDVLLVGACYHMVQKQTKEGQAVMDPVTTPLEVKPTWISKGNTCLQFGVLTWALCKGVMLEQGDGGWEWVRVWVEQEDLFLGLCWITAGTTVASAYSYVGGASLTSICKDSVSATKTATGREEDSKLGR